MNLLSAVMPGIREARTPLSVGALWIVFAYLLVAPRWASVAAYFPDAVWLRSALADVPVVYVFGGLTFLAYLVGLATQPISMQLGRVLLRPFRRAEHQDDPPEGGLARSFYLWVHERIDVSRYRTPVLDAVASAYVKAGVPAPMSPHYPAKEVLKRLDSLALQLWQKNADQYQEYDRLRAERNFRRGIWLPLVAVASAVASLSVWWVGAVVLLVVIQGSLTLLYQSWIIDYRRRIIIADALLQGLVEDAEVKSMVQILATLELPPHWRDRKSVRCALTAVAFARMGDFDSADQLTLEAAAAVVPDALPGLRDGEREAKVDRARSQRAIKAIAEEVREIYRKNQEADKIAAFDAQLRRGREVPPFT